MCILLFVIYTLIVPLYNSQFGALYFAIYIYTLIGLQFVAPVILFVCAHTCMYCSIPALYTLISDRQLLSRRRVSLRERWKSLTYYEMMQTEATISVYRWSIWHDYTKISAQSNNKIHSKIYKNCLFYSLSNSQQFLLMYGSFWMHFTSKFIAPNQ